MKPWPGSILAALSAWVTGWAYPAPFRKTSLARADGLPADRMVVVALSATEHRPRMRREFFRDTRRVLAELPTQPGLVGYSFRFELLGPSAWTMTAWDNDASLNAFVRSPAHREALRRSGETVQNLRFATIEMPVGSLPINWREARRLLAEADEKKPAHPQAIHAPAGIGRPH